MTAQETKARYLIGLQTTEKIIEQFELTEDMSGEHVPTVRGWYMDELEKRNPDAFDQWIDSDEASPRKFYPVKPVSKI